MSRGGGVIARDAPPPLPPLCSSIVLTHLFAASLHVFNAHLTLARASQFQQLHSSLRNDELEAAKQRTGRRNSPFSPRRRRREAELCFEEEERGGRDVEESDGEASLVGSLLDKAGEGAREAERWRADPRVMSSSSRADLSFVGLPSDCRERRVRRSVPERSSLISDEILTLVRKRHQERFSFCSSLRLVTPLSTLSSLPTSSS